MRDKKMNRWSTYEPYYIELAGHKIADIVITSHAQDRWTERVNQDEADIEHICDFLWTKLKEGTIAPYFANEKEVYVIEEDLVLVAEFSELPDETDIAGNPLHRWIIVTFLGKLSEDIQLRDLRTYYSWLRHTRRMTLLKNSRKKK